MRYLRARITETGDLELEGHDLGPGTAMVSPDGEYEWWRLPALRQLLSIPEGEDLLDALAASWSGPRSCDLDAALRDAAIPTELSVYS